MNLCDKTGRIIETAVVDDKDKIVIITTNGIMLKIRVSEIRSCGRSTQGVKLINVTPGDWVGSLARIPTAEAPGEAIKPQPKPPKGTLEDAIGPEEELDGELVGEDLDEELADEDVGEEPGDEE